MDTGANTPKGEGGVRVSAHTRGTVVTSIVGTTVGLTDTGSWAVVGTLVIKGAGMVGVFVRPQAEKSKISKRKTLILANFLFTSEHPSYDRVFVPYSAISDI
jgi:hypothetical protein